MRIELQNTEEYLTEEYYLYYQIYNSLKSQIKSLQNSKPRTIHAAKRIETIIKAKEYNLVHLGEIVAALKPNVIIEHLLSIKKTQAFQRGQNNPNAYLKDFKYMIRDWCGVAAGESQVSRIVSELKTQTKRFAPDDENILFLGAGTGRIAFEHNDSFKKVYALDRSYSMVHHFDQLLKDDFSFYEINEYNVLKTEHTTKKHTASLKNASKESVSHQNRFEYFIGDAMNLPFEDASLSCITSVYFTDVIALQLYFDELQRTLKPGGLFIHFGPLDYFFYDRAEMLTTEEFAKEFTDNGFKVLHEDVIELPHLDRPLKMVKRIYKNWFFIAQKLTEPEQKSDEEIVYAIEQAVFVQNRRLIGSSEKIGTELVNKDGAVFEGVDDLIPILELLDGKSKLGEIFGKIKSELKLDLNNQEQAELKDVFTSLVDKKIIKVV